MRTIIGYEKTNLNAAPIIDKIRAAASAMPTMGSTTAPMSLIHISEHTRPY